MLDRKELIRLRSEAHDAEQALRRIGETNIANRTPGELVTIELYYTKQKIKVEQAVQAYQNALAEFAAQELADEQKEQAEADERFVVAFNNLKGSVAPDAFEDQMNERAASEGWKPDDDYVEEWAQQERKVLHGVEARQPVPGETKRRVMTEAEKQARILEEFGPELGPEYEHRINTDPKSADY